MKQNSQSTFKKRKILKIIFYFLRIKNWLDSQEVVSTESDFLCDSEKDYKKNEKTDFKLPKIKFSSKKLEYSDKRFTRSDSSFNKMLMEDKEMKSLSRLSEKSISQSQGRFSSQSDYKSKSRKNLTNSNDPTTNEKFKHIEKIDENINVLDEKKNSNLQSLET